jgi:hypothetical protein
LGDPLQAELWAREAIAILEGTSAHDNLAACYEVLSGIYADLERESLATQYAVRAAGLRQQRVPHHSPRTAYLLERGLQPVAV